jgi:hypothetical protein
MKRLVITRLAGAGSLPGDEGAFLALETSEGPARRFESGAEMRQ